MHSPINRSANPGGTKDDQKTTNYWKFRAQIWILLYSRCSWNSSSPV
jgi:hypothetical protein